MFQMSTLWFHGALRTTSGIRATEDGIADGDLSLTHATKKVGDVSSRALPLQDWKRVKSWQRTEAKVGESDRYVRGCL